MFAYTKSDCCEIWDGHANGNTHEHLISDVAGVGLILLLWVTSQYLTNLLESLDLFIPYTPKLKPAIKLSLLLLQANLSSLLLSLHSN